MKPRLLPAVACLVLLTCFAGCREDKPHREYVGLADYSRDGAVADKYMAAPILPKSAYGIVVDLAEAKQEVSLDFDFAPNDLGVAVSGFVVMVKPDRKHLVDTHWLKLPDPNAVVMRRCSAQRLEIVALSTRFRIHYQSTPEPGLVYYFCRRDA